MTTLQAVLDRLHGVRRNRDGYLARCPAHDDRNPSLAVSEGKDGRVLMHCHAGCDPESVCAAINLHVADLFGGDPIEPRGTTSKPRKPDATGGRVFTSARAAIAALEHQHGKRAAHWTYRNSENEPVLVVVRFDAPAGDGNGPSKTFRPVGKRDDGWRVSDPPGPLPLYGLPQLLAANPIERVFVVEGEKAADAARSLGLLATTTAHGAKSARKSDLSPFVDRDIAILPDHDSAGEQYANDVSRLATAAGARSVTIVRLADRWIDLPDGGDIADLVHGAAGDAEALKQLHAEVVAMAETGMPKPPRPIGRSALAFRPFPSAVLPEPTRSFVEDVARSIGCDPSYIALPLLAALASAIGNSRRIELKRGWSEPSILWAAIVGESGTHKTPAFKEALRAIRKAQEAAFKEHETARAEWETNVQRYEAALAAWKRESTHGAGVTGDPPVGRRHRSLAGTSSPTRRPRHWLRSCWAIPEACYWRGTN